jgi:hypothetical protein
VRSSFRRIAENGGSIEKKQGPVKERKTGEENKETRTGIRV